ncbi:MAG TPA: hypothetical protein DCY20_04425 [Firmicutes bacterium]|nr:hypothetical protein [Bacillota bacterium]
MVKKNAPDLISKRISIEMSHLEYDVYTDPKWVEFILNQIVGNVIKYCRDNQRKLKIYATTFEHQITLCIQDNGIGISERDVPRVFDKGFTGENGRLLGKSTGIGLYLCKKIM